MLKLQVEKSNRIILFFIKDIPAPLIRERQFAHPKNSKMNRLFHATAVFSSLGPAVSFTIPMSRFDFPLFASTSIGTNDASRSSIRQDSEIKQLVKEVRSVYQDLEFGGGSIRRDMDGVSFTYVAPSDCSHLKSSVSYLDGLWRDQIPTTYEAGADWSTIHVQTTDERMKYTSLSKPPPMVVYLPGLDGFGISATSQLDDLSSSFELWRMTVDKDNRSSFSELMKSVVTFVQDATKSFTSAREVIIVGESFGGLLACAVAMALTTNASKFNIILKGMVLVNPATSFDETNWEQLLPLLTSLRYLETQEETDDNFETSRNRDDSGRPPTPYSVLGGIVLSTMIPSRTQFSSIVDFFMRSARNDPPQDLLSASSDGFRILAEYLPATTVEHRVLKWLPVGTSVVNNPQRLSNLQVPTLVIAGTEDNMLPTKEEANRLAMLLPDCVKMDIQGSGHFVLDAMNLTEVILDSHIDPMNHRKNSAYDLITDWALPPKDIVERVIAKRVAPQRERASPVFFSTDSTGKRRRGLSLVPSKTNWPLLFVGNHQLFAQDLGMLISQLIEERGIVARGLMHPIAADGFTATTGPDEPKIRTQKRKWDFNEDNPADTNLFPMFGAVKVNPRNFYRLLQTDQTVLLFPGGVREALHGKDEDYQVFWPEKTDFVRVAAKFNATIVPLAAIGSADSFEILLDSTQLLRLPFGIGESLGNFSKNATAARYDTENGDEVFIPPLALPKPFSARHYFLFGRPFHTSALDPKDKEACQMLYRKVGDELKADIDALLQARMHDPYALDGVKRVAYQRITGKEPPTFPLQALAPSKL